MVGYSGLRSINHLNLKLIIRSTNIGCKGELMMQKIIPCLWFNNQAEEAARFYTSIFENSKMDQTSYYGDAGPGMKGSVLTVTFMVKGQEIMALNGGPEYKFTPAISLFVNCEDQQEVDYFWERLSEGGEKGRCGWLTDKFGVSWQIVPNILGVLMSDKDEKKAARVMQAMLQMDKLEIDKLQKAYQEA
jgi:predicted 3-demethylubiquinone-9 3-methyltransferase (glyoxalase superfamily)